MDYKQVIKRETKIIALSVIGMCLIIISTSYALFFKVNTSTNNQVVETGTLTTTFSNGDTLTTAVTPQSDAEGLATTGYSFSVTNTGTLPMEYEITIYNDPDVDLTNALAQQYLRISLDNGTPQTLSTVTKTVDTASETNENNIKYLLASNLYLMASGTTGDTATHNVKLWIDEDAPESIIGKTVALEISVNGVVAEDGLPLNARLLSNAGGTTAIAAKGTPTFSTVATTDEGMYAMADDYGTSYYYRGAVTNNNVLFGGYCWKVIRINGNGTTRMIYNGTQKDIYTSTTLTQTEYLNVTNDATYAYTYDTGTNQWTSTNHTDGATGTITFQVGTAGNYAFNYIVSSQAGYDKATVYVDNVSKGEFSGLSTSSLFLTGLTTSSVIKVTYTKNSSGTSGNDNIIFSLGKNPVSGKTCANTGDATQISKSAFNSNWNDNAYVGYMYGTVGSSTYAATHANTNSSTIKTVIDTWYNTNLSSYASKISDTEFCNDRSIASASATWDSSDTALGYGTNYTYYGAFNRIVNNNTPILTCPNKHDRFTVDDTGVGNGDLTYPISLITADEVAIAGGVTANNSYYLYTGSYYWTVSADYFFGAIAGGFDVYLDGRLYSSDVDISVIGLRPVINLNTGTLFTSGDGTVTNPFVIS